MYIATVCPIAQLSKNLPEKLSYFVYEPINLGAIVEITIQKKQYPAILVSIDPLSARKLEIKKSAFSLKKIKKILSPNPVVHPALLTTAQSLSVYYREPLGAVLKVFIPSLLFNIPIPSRAQTENQNTFRDRQHDLIIGTFADRIQYYKMIIREAFAKNKSVALFVPTISLAEYCYHALSDLPKRAVLIHGGLKEKGLKAQLSAITGETPSPLIIGTPLALGCLMGFESIIIIEDACSSHYFRQEHPYMQTTTAIKLYADTTQAKCIEGKTMPSLSDIKNNTKPHLLSSRRSGNQSPGLIDTSDEPFQALSETSRNFIRDTKKPIILFINRKGFYSFVLCLDCGHSMQCAQCSAPLTLHATVRRGYICHRCQSEYPPDTKCASCGSWNLKGFGVGSERVADEAHKAFPGRYLWQFDDNTAKNALQKASIKKAFLESESGILVATDLALEDPSLMAAAVIVINIDNLFSIPDYSIGERILVTLAKCEERSREYPLMIQTRFPKHSIFQHFTRHDFRGFLTAELQERKENNFPPYTIFIKITLEHKNTAELARRAEFAVQYFKKFSDTVLSYPSFSQKIKHHILVAVAESVWRDNSDPLKESLGVFPYPADIVVDPPSIL
jgi:primosomal protein N'